MLLWFDGVNLVKIRMKNINIARFLYTKYVVVFFSSVIEPQEKLTWDWRLGFKRALQDVAKALELHIRHITGE